MTGWIIGTLLLLLLPAVSLANSLTADKMIAAPGEPITFTSTFHFSSTSPYGIFRIYLDFGDGKKFHMQIDGYEGQIQTFRRKHSYAKEGVYTVHLVHSDGYGLQQVFNSPVLPAIQVKIVAKSSDKDTAISDKLPEGVVGEEYEHSLHENFGKDIRSWRIVGNRLPPGLSMDRKGMISGVPTKAGNYPFTIEARKGSEAITHEFTLIVKPGVVAIKTQPETIYLSQRPQMQRLLFEVVKPTEPFNDIVRSQRGEFVQNGRVIGFGGRPLSINLNQPRPQVAETVTVPPAVLQAVRASGNPQFSYRRNFTSRNFEEGRGESEVTFRTSAAGQLRITGLRVYFPQNNRPQIMVQRNERGLTGAIDIDYNGSGMLKGYWQVDNRRLQHIQKNLFYGKVLTLKTPEIPPLPTYSEGAHRLRFVITEPKFSSGDNFKFPEAFYYVEGGRAAVVTAIEAVSPADRERIDAASALFSWSPVTGSISSLIEFFVKGEKVPIFSAYSRGNSYILPPVVIKQRFSDTSRSYQWQVKSFNKAEEINGESGLQEFSVKQGE